VPRQHDLAEQIADLRATTLAGLRVKANVLLSYSGYDLDGDPLWSDHDDLMGWSIARDLCGDAAARHRGAAVMPRHKPPPRAMAGRGRSGCRVPSRLRPQADRAGRTGRAKHTQAIYDLYATWLTAGPPWVR
jgi:hypothetical protein